MFIHLRMSPTIRHIIMDILQDGLHLQRLSHSAFMLLPGAAIMAVITAAITTAEITTSLLTITTTSIITIIIRCGPTVCRITRPGVIMAMDERIGRQEHRTGRVYRIIEPEQTIGQAYPIIRREHPTGRGHQ